MSLPIVMFHRVPALAVVVGPVVGPPVGLVPPVVGPVGVPPALAPVVGPPVVGPVVPPVGLVPIGVVGPGVLIGVGVGVIIGVGAGVGGAIGLGVPIGRVPPLLLVELLNRPLKKPSKMPFPPRVVVFVVIVAVVGIIPVGLNDPFVVRLLIRSVVCRLACKVFLKAFGHKALARLLVNVMCRNGCLYRC